MIGAVYTLEGMVMEILNLWMAEMAYLLYFRKAQRFYGKMLLMLFLMFPAGLWIVNTDPEHFEIWAAGIFFLMFAVLGKYAAEIPLGVSTYLGVWSMMTYLLACGGWHYLSFVLFGGEYGNLKWSLTHMIVTVLVYVILILTVDYWMHVYKSGKMGPRQLTSAVVLYAVLVIQQFHFYHNLKYMANRSMDCVFILCQMLVVLLIYLQSTLFQKSRLQQEYDILNLLWHQKEEQYEKARENIELINRKCHDMKHQIAAMRTMDSSSQREQYYQEIEKSIRIYEMNYNTGNETLDTVLTDKGLLCETKNITVNCVADGENLSFMDPVDIYTVMGNALDNAIEAVEKLEEKECRLVDVLIHVRQKFLIINVTNPTREQVSLKDGLPSTSKGDRRYHGYGVRSIQHTVRKYGGEMTIHVEHHLFSLRIMIPIKAPAQPAAQQHA